MNAASKARPNRQFTLRLLPVMVGLALLAMGNQNSLARSNETTAAFTATQLVRQFTLKNTVAQVNQGMQGYVTEVNGQLRSAGMGPTPSNYPVGMGSVPGSVNLPQRDGAGRPLGYCAWDNSSASSDANYLAGAGIANPLVHAVVSPGLNGSIETTCAEILLNGVGNSDDYVLTTAPTQASSRQFRSAVSTEAELFAMTGENGDVRLVAETNRLYSYFDGTWSAIGPATTFVDDSAANGSGAISYTGGKVTVGDFQAASALVTGSISAGSLAGNGSGLTDLNMSNAGSGVLSTAFGGTGVNSSAASNGQLLIGNGSGFALGGLTAGAGIGILNGAGSITISNTGVTSLAGTLDQVIVSGATGDITLSLPQAIGVTSSPTFGGVSLNGALTGTDASFTGAVNLSALSVAGVPATLAFTYANSTGDANYRDNLALGVGALAGEKRGGNVSIGPLSLASLISSADPTRGTQNTALGSEAMFANQTGRDNVAVGQASMYSNTSGEFNTATGSAAMFSNTTGNYNAAFGQGALYNNTVGQFNTAIGQSALFNSSGNRNTALGQSVMFANTTGADNTAVGQFALGNNMTGSNNVAMGQAALFSVTTGQYSTGLGQGADVSNGALNYAAAIGASSRVSTNNTLVLGALAASKNGSVSTIDDQVVIGATSRNDSQLNTKLFVNGAVNIADKLFVNGIEINKNGTTNAGDIDSGLLGTAFGGTGVNGSTAANGQLLIGNGSGYTLANITGTANQINVANGAGSITLSLPQSIATNSSPSFSGLSISGNVGVAGTLSANEVSATRVRGRSVAAFCSVAEDCTAAALVSGQGAYLQWNRVPGSGQTYLINQKGAGVGGISFGESTADNVYTQNMRITAIGNLEVRNNLNAVGGDFSGTVNANAFVGDGSGLTNLELSQFNTGTLNVAQGGTGLDASAAANGQLLIGNGSGYTLGNITGTSNQVSVTNGAGSIRLSLPQDISTASSPTFAGTTLTSNLSMFPAYASAPALISLGGADSGFAGDGRYHGIRLWGLGNSTMAIYVAGASGRTASGAVPQMLGSVNEFAMRFRQSTNAGYGFIFENSNNTALASISSVTGDFTSIGNLAGKRLLIGDATGVGAANIAVGTGALSAAQSGVGGNTAVGLNALTSNTSGGFNLAIGANANVASGALNYASAIGADSLVSTSNTIALGRASSDQVVIGATSRNDTQLNTKLFVNGAVNIADKLFVNGVEVTGGGSSNASDIDSGLLASTFGGTGVNGSAAANGQLLIGNGSGYTLGNITGTSNQVSVTNGAGSIRLSLPQDISTASSPTFAGTTLTSNLSMFPAYASAPALISLGGANSGFAGDGRYHGIRLWGLANDRMAIYVAGSSGRTPSGAVPQMLGSVTEFSTRFRQGNFAGDGFVFENSSDIAVASISSATGDFTSIGNLAGKRLLIGDATGVGAANIAVGTGALSAAQSGVGGNTAVGLNALTSNTSGGFNLAIGANANVTSGALNYASAIGADSLVSTSNTIALGRASSDQVVIGATSRNDTFTDTRLFVQGASNLNGDLRGTTATFSGEVNVNSNLRVRNNALLSFQSLDGTGSPLFMQRIDNGPNGADFRLSMGNFNVGFGSAETSRFQIGNRESGIFAARFEVAANGEVKSDSTISAVSFNSTSDRRLKTNIQAVDVDALTARLASLQPYTYNYINAPEAGLRLGVIAQELLPIFPEAVFMGANGFYSVDYGAIGALAAAGVGRLNDRVIELDKAFKESGSAQTVARIDTLEGTVGEHGQRIGELESWKLSAEKQLTKADERLGTLETWRTSATEKMDAMQTAIDLNIQKIADNAVAIQANTAAIERLDDALFTLDGRVKNNSDLITSINARWAKNFNASDDGSVLAVNAAELKVSNFTAQNLRANTVYSMRLEAEMARIADLEVNSLRANSAVANTVQAEQLNTGSAQVYAGVGLPAVLFSAKSDGHYTVNTSALDGSYATATVIVNAGQAKVIAGQSEGIELYAEGNTVKALAAGKSIKASWIKTG